MFVATGEAVDTPMLLQGNPSLVKMDAPVKRILDTILEEGFEHHHSTIYGDISRELQWFCELMSMEMVKPE
jgi:L-fucose isomerase-like protein